MTNFHLKTQATGHLLLGANQAGLEEGVGIKLSRGELTAGGLTPVTAAIKDQINHHKPSHISPRRHKHKKWTRGQKPSFFGFSTKMSTNHPGSSLPPSPPS